VAQKIDSNLSILTLSLLSTKNTRVKLSLFSKNFLSLLGSNFAVQGLRFLTIALLARRLGTEVFGVYSYLTLLITYGFTVVEFGLRNLALREIAQGRGSSELVKVILKVRSVLAILGSVTVVGFSLLAFPGGKYLVPSIFFALSLFVDAFLIDFVVIAHERLVTQSIANISQALLVYVATFFLVKRADQFTLFSEIFFLSHVLWVGYFYLSGRPLLNSSEKKVGLKVIDIAKVGLPILVGQFLFSMQASIDFLLLGQFHYIDRLGDYSAAMKILSIPQGVIFAFFNAMYPRLAKYSDNIQSQETLGLLNTTMKLIWIIIIPMVIGSWLFGDQLISLFFGENYIHATAVLKPLSIAMAFYFLGIGPMATILISHKTRLMIKLAGFNLSVSFIAAFIVMWAKRPDLLPWAMIVAQGSFMVASWRPFKIRGYLSFYKK